MKRYFVLRTGLVVFIILNTFMILAQDSSATGNVYFMRRPLAAFGEGLLNRAMNYYNVFIDSNFVCALNERRYSVHKVSNGRHSFSVQYRGKKPKPHSDDITIKIETGKSYYIVLEFYGGISSNDIICHRIREDLAKMILPSLKKDKSCDGKE